MEIVVSTVHLIICGKRNVVWYGHSDFNMLKGALFSRNNSVLSSADKLCKQFGPKPGPKERFPDLDPNRAHSDSVPENISFEKEIKQVNRRQQKHEKLSSMHRVNSY